MLSFYRCPLLKNFASQLQKIAFVSQKFESTTANKSDDSVPPDDEIPPEGRPKANKVQDEIRQTIGAGVHISGLFPTIDTHTNLLINNVPYNKTHIVNIKSSKNNTIMSLTDFKGTVLNMQTAGTNGFKNAKKSTAIAAQAAGFSLAENIKRRGIKDIRVVLKGFGNGRLASLKSLQMSGVNIVSLTDHTPVPYPHQTPLRPRKARRV